MKLRLGVVGAVIGGPPVAIFLPQPLSQTFGLPAPRNGEPFGMVQILTKSCPRVRGKWHGEAMTKGE